MEAVASFFESLENFISTRPVTEPLHDIAGYFEIGLNLFSLHYDLSYQINIESSRHPTAKCYEEDAIVTIVSFNTMLYISRSFFPPESMFS